MIQKLLPVIFSCLCTYSMAQRDFRKGYIITNEGDTVAGVIDYRGDVRNSKVCAFKKSGTDNVVEYLPTDIAAYRFTDSKYYVSKNLGTTDLPQQVFLEYLVNGLAKIYYYRDNDLGNHYYLEKDDRFLELKMYEKEVYEDDKVKVKTMKPYIGLLKATLNVWDLNDKIDRTMLDHQPLIDIAKDYHQYVCTDGSECIIYEKKKSLIALRIAPVIGIDISTLKLMDFGVEKYNFDPSTNFTIGINVNLSIPTINEKIFLQIQTLYSKYYFFDAYESSRDATDVHIRSNVLQMGLAVKYEYPKGRWRPTLAAGASAIYLPGGTVKEITDNYNYIDEIRPSLKKSDFPTKFMFGFEVTPGIHYYCTNERIIFIQLQYLRCFQREFVNYPANGIQSFGLLTGIYF